MAYSQEKFDEYFSKMATYKKVANKNNVPLKDFLLKFDDVDTELADALIWAQENFNKLFDKMSVYEKTAIDNDVSVKQVLMKIPDVDEGLADALVNHFEKSKNKKVASTNEKQHNCPKCGSDNIQNGECLKCRIVLAKYLKTKANNQMESISRKSPKAKTPSGFFKFALLLAVIILVITIVHEVILVPNAFRKRAEAGGVYTKTHIAHLFADGIDVFKDIKLSLDLYRKAAEQGHVPAQYALGNSYTTKQRYGFDGIHEIPADTKLAAYWLRKAAEQGHAWAALSLSNLYEEGDGVPQDNAAAEYWNRIYEIQYQKHDMSAFEDMKRGLYYVQEFKDYTKAAYWYRKAAEQGYELAAYCLGECYENGDGVEQDNAAAVYWYRKAVGRGYKNARAKLIKTSSKGKIFQTLILPFRLFHNYLYVGYDIGVDRIIYIFPLFWLAGILIAFFLPLFLGRPIWDKLKKQ